jgi:hypothetical protein
VRIWTQYVRPLQAQTSKVERTDLCENKMSRLPYNPLPRSTEDLESHAVPR